jgi:hypothetical protein
VEIGVAEALSGETVERRHRHGATEGAGDAEAQVVDEDDHDVRRAGRRLHAEVRGRLDVASIEFRDDRSRGLLDREDRPVECRRRCRRGAAGAGDQQQRAGAGSAYPPCFEHDHRIPLLVWL